MSSGTGAGSYGTGNSKNPHQCLEEKPAEEQTDFPPRSSGTGAGLYGTGNSKNPRQCLEEKPAEEQTDFSPKSSGTGAGFYGTGIGEKRYVRTFKICEY